MDYQIGVPVRTSENCTCTVLYEACNLRIVHEQYRESYNGGGPSEYFMLEIAENDLLGNVSWRKAGYACASAASLINRLREMANALEESRWTAEVAAQ